MRDSVKKAKVQLPQDIFPAEAWELRTNEQGWRYLIKG